ncbi:signaling protein, partial [gut metagenome]
MDKYGNDYHPLFHAGVYMLQPSDRNCEAVLFNARHGYKQAISREIPFAFAKAEQLNQEKEQIQLKKQTLTALQNQEFRMFLQPIVRGENAEICGAEAVSRWNHPQKGLLFPNV